MPLPTATVPKPSTASDDSSSHTHSSTTPILEQTEQTIDVCLDRLAVADATLTTVQSEVRALTVESMLIAARLVSTSLQRT